MPFNMNTTYNNNMFIDASAVHFRTNTYTILSAAIAIDYWNKTLCVADTHLRRTTPPRLDRVVHILAILCVYTKEIDEKIIREYWKRVQTCKYTDGGKMSSSNIERSQTGYYNNMRSVVRIVQHAHIIIMIHTRRAAWGTFRVRKVWM